MAVSLAELVTTGELALHRELRESFAPGVLELFRVPGLGSKRIRTLVGLGPGAV